LPFFYLPTPPYFNLFYFNSFEHPYSYIYLYKLIVF